MSEDTIKNYLTKGKTISTKVKDCFLYNISKRTESKTKECANFKFEVKSYVK